MTPSGEGEEAPLHALILVLGSQEPAPQSPAPCKDLSLRNLHPRPIQGQMRPTGAEHMLPARRKKYTKDCGTRCDFVLPPWTTQDL